MESCTNLKMTENMTLYPGPGYERFDERAEDGFHYACYRKTLKQEIGT